MPRIVLLSRYFPPTNIVGAIRPFRLAKHAARAGWDVDVVHGPHDFNRIETSLEELEGGPLRTIAVSSETPGAIDRIAPAQLRRRGRHVVSKLMGTDLDIGFARRAASAVARLHQEHGPWTDEVVMVTTSPPHSLHTAGLTLRKSLAMPWIVDLRDPWDRFTETGRYNQPNPLARWRERRVMVSADYVVSSTPGYTRILQERFPDVPPQRFRTITNSFSSESVGETQSPRRDRLTIVYTGIFYADKDPYTFFRAIAHWIRTSAPERRRVIERHFRIRLVGVEDRTTPTVISDLGLGSLTELVPRVPQREALALCREADFLLIASGLTEKSREGWLPSKVFEYLKCRKPIIAVCRQGELANLITETGSGYLFHDEDPEPIAALLDTALTQKLETGEIRNELTFRGIEDYSEEHMAGQFLSLAEELLHTRRPDHP